MQQKVLLSLEEKVPENYTGIVQCSNGTKEWRKDGKLHRLDGPAIEYLNGKKYWFKEGKRHREDGPAIDWREYKVWYLEGETLNNPRDFPLSNAIVLDVITHSKYPLVKIIKLLLKDSINEICILPGMELYSRI